MSLCLPNEQEHFSIQYMIYVCICIEIFFDLFVNNNKKYDRIFNENLQPLQMHSI